MMYKIYLRTHDQQVDPSTKSITADRDEAAAAFAGLVARVDLDGRQVAAVLSYNAVRLAFHRFDKAAGENDYWRSRLNEIEWPTATPAKGGAGGARAGAGRRVQTSDG